ncbi:hypothetical protein [Desulfovibrio sp. JC022]|uniref:hypothetical protein n=1 Tax=Desulfovibrio sp. JC022 TaxID=2593642 RepID=UPI0013D5AA94|nr:hypothetical protein [Desulfovibrio sp. JC022]NDV22436.1 hypothetical protein [Desulfovibrio sp. JC022]
MYFLITLVFSFLIFMILYARYLNVSGSIGQRKLQLENLRDNVEFRINKLNKGSAEINREIAEASARLDLLRRNLNDAGSSKK